MRRGSGGKPWEGLIAYAPDVATAEAAPVCGGYPTLSRGVGPGAAEGGPARVWDLRDGEDGSGEAAGPDGKAEEADGQTPGQEVARRAEGGGHEPQVRLEEEAAIRVRFEEAAEVEEVGPGDPSKE